MEQVKETGKSPLYVYWQAALPDRGKLLLTLLLACLAAALEIVPFVLIWVIAREAFENMAGTDRALWLTGGILGAILLRFAIQGAVTILGHLAGFRSECRLRCRLIDHMKTVMPAAVEGKSAQLSRAAMDEVGRLNGILAHTIPDAIAGVFMFLICAVLLLWADWRLAMVSCSMLALGAWAQVRIAKASPEMFVRWVQADGRASSALLFYVRGLATLRAFNRQASSLNEVTDSIFAIGKLAGEVTRACAVPYSLFGLAMTSPLLVILPCALLLHEYGSLGTADLVFATAISGIMLLPLTKVVMSLTALRLLQAAAAHIRDMMALPAFADPPAYKPVTGAEVVFENVSYSIASGSGEEVSILRNINFTLPQGRITTVTGPSGSGKTTLARLLARLDDVSQGRILIGGQDIRDLPILQFQKLVSIVFQDAFLFHGTIRENVLLAKPDATESELANAIEAAGCAEMLKYMPLGLDTPVGDKGLGLSGGEQQRIAIARAFLKNAPILILDEATAHLDPLAAKDITRSLKRLMTDKTVFAISHRLNEIENAHATLVVVNGSLEKQGTHGELLASSAVYQNLWQLQTRSSAWRLGMERARGEVA
ncbi:ABC transporter ATP-binding protein [Desulfovibrio sp. QI0430]